MGPKLIEVGTISDVAWDPRACAWGWKGDVGSGEGVQICCAEF